ncbi:MAG: hypothetical protein HDR83_00550 [Bacteroides sp.]|nr:hypothetical protein [Bacteroides sp.]
MKKILLLFFITFGLIPVSVDAGISSTSSGEKSTILISKKNTSGRPGVPSKFTIGCYYGDGYIGFVFPTGINLISINISNEIEEWSGVATTDEPVLETPHFSGEYEIECVADNGHTFVGIIEF